MDKIGILRCGVIQMLSIKVPYTDHGYKNVIVIKFSSILTKTSENYFDIIKYVNCPFDISVGVGAFVIGLSQISSFLSGHIFNAFGLAVLSYSISLTELETSAIQIESSLIQLESFIIELESSAIELGSSLINSRAL